MTAAATAENDNSPVTRLTAVNLKIGIGGSCGSRGCSQPFEAGLENKHGRIRPESAAHTPATWRNSTNAKSLCEFRLLGGDKNRYFPENRPPGRKRVDNGKANA